MSKFTKLLFIILAINILSISTINAQQKESREQRRERRIQTNKEEMQNMLRKIESGNFEFVATEIISTGRAAFSNIRLLSLWYVEVSPKRFKCYLPIYGTSSPVGQPSLRERLNIFASDYQMEIDGNDKILQVSIDVKGDTYSTKYNFRFNITSSGLSSTLTVSSSFRTPVSFRGNIR